MKNTNSNFATQYPLETRLLKVSLGITLLCLILGLITPILTINKFILIEHTFSIVNGTLQLLKEGQFFLFVLISLFSIVLPFLKIIILWILLSMTSIKTSRLNRYLHWMHLYGKWSMLDVFVVAILVVTVKLGAIASVEIHYGLYFFTIAVILTMVVTSRVVTLTEALKENSLIR